MIRITTLPAVLFLGFCIPAVSANPPDGPSQAAPTQTLPTKVADETNRAIARGLDFLKSTQTPEGGWTPQYGPAITAIVAKAFTQHEAYGPRHPIVRRAVANILRYAQTDGGIYERQQNLANYQTSIALEFLCSLHDPALKPHIAKAQTFLTKLQLDEAESVDRDNPWYGGAGYNKTKRPDLSNTQMMLEALRQSGLPKDDPAYQRALVFVSRCQNFDPTNDQAFANGATDGGFIYSPNAGGESKANEKTKEGQGSFMSYGSMTYAGFKSLLYAGVERDDPRIKACLGWIQKHYTLDQNPNMPGKRSSEGLYYYFHVFAKALDVWGKPVIVDASGEKHVWRVDLCRKIVSLQQPNGSWINDQDRWAEGDANYVTGLTILSLQRAMKCTSDKAIKSTTVSDAQDRTGDKAIGVRPSGRPTKE